MLKAAPCQLPVPVLGPRLLHRDEGSPAYVWSVM